MCSIELSVSCSPGHCHSKKSLLEVIRLVSQRYVFGWLAFVCAHLGHN